MVVYFESVIANVKNYQPFKVKLMIDMLKNKEVKKLFQANYTYLLSTVGEINYLCRSFELRIFYHADHVKSIDNIVFGFEFVALSPNSDSKMRAFRNLNKIYSESLWSMEQPAPRSVTCSTLG